MVGANVNDIKSFRKLIDETSLHTFHNNGLEFEEQKTLFNDTVKEMNSVLGDIQSASSQKEIDDIRERLEAVRRYVVNFNKNGVAKNKWAVDIRFAREVFEHHVEVIRARESLGKDYGGIDESAGDYGNRIEIADDAVYVGGSERLGGDERENTSPPSYSVGAERDGAENFFQELYKEQIETDKRIHLDDYRMNQGRSKQGALSYSQNRKGNYACSQLVRPPPKSGVERRIRRFSFFRRQSPIGYHLVRVGAKIPMFSTVTRIFRTISD